MADDIPGSDLLIERWPVVPVGGQHVGTGPNGVKITHLPTGLVAMCDTERSQHRNRTIALDMIMGGLTSPGFRGGGYQTSVKAAALDYECENCIGMSDYGCYCQAMGATKPGGT